MGRLSFIYVSDKKFATFIGNISRNQCTVIQAISENSTPNLKTQLASGNFQEKNAYLVLPRHHAVLKDFDLPLCNDQEIDQMIFFQLEKELPIPLTDILYVYKLQKLERKLRVHAVVVKRETIESIINQLKSCSIKISGIVLTTHSLVKLIPEKGNALICNFDEYIELIINNDVLTIFSHSISTVGKTPQETAEEIKRIIISYKSHSGEFNKIKLISNSNELYESVKNTLSIPIERLDGDPHITCLKSAAQNFRSLPDILNPIRVKKKSRLPIFMKARLNLAIFAAVVVVLSIGGLFVWANSNEMKLALLKEGFPQLKAKKESLGKINSVNITCNKWLRNQVDWFKVLVELSFLFDTHLFYVTSIQYHEDTNLIRITARAKDKDDIIRLQDRFKNLSTVQLDAKSQIGSRSVEKEPNGYKWEFNLGLNPK